MNKTLFLPRSLRQLISETLALLNEVIEEQAGSAFYCQLQLLQKKMANEHFCSHRRWQEILYNTYQELGTVDRNTKRLLIHSFTLMIEIMNACETAYRTYRINQKKSFSQIPQSNNAIVFVLTAHPTEARSPANILLFQQVHACCLELLQPSDRSNPRQRLKHVLKLAWLTPVARHRRPEVLDEAESIFSTILRQDILDELIVLRQSGIDIRIRTWVGGDKDGHPGVNETVMLKVMTCARKRFIKIIKNKLKQIHKDISLTELSFKKIKQLLMICSDSLNNLSVLKTGDCLHLLDFKKNFKALKACYEEEIGVLHPEIININTLLKIFPALLIPLELREDAKEIHSALSADKPYAITRMLQGIAQLCDHSNVEDYIKGFILSMTQSMADIKAGLQLVEQVFGYKQIRVVPLFETEQALKQAVNVVENLFKEKAIFDHIKTNWNNRFEVMLGYSDSAKGMGVLPSRLAIANTMHNLDKLCQHYEIMPVFFHGSGGSVDRGGGSIQEQTAWWPQSSFYIYKTTLQGEMVERNFASQPIMTNMIQKLVTEAGKEHSQLLEKSAVIQGFADQVSGYYQKQVQDPEFLDVVAKATSYRLLDKLKFGSRPVKRNKSLSIHSLRAIPWVLCWTQTRILFPTWWGVGSAWQNCRAEDRKELQEAFVSNPLFRSFIKLLGFTLAKVDLSIWNIYLLTSNLNPEIQHKMIMLFSSEYKMAHEAVLSISNQTNLLWFRPWLQESIKLRSSLIHPLNLLQIHAIKENDAFLIRETTTGIAAGMLTTG